MVKLLLKRHEQVESELLKEVAGLAAGFSELEEQNNAKVDALIKKEDEIVSLQTEVSFAIVTDGQ